MTYTVRCEHPLSSGLFGTEVCGADTKHGNEFCPRHLSYIFEGAA